MKNRVFCLLIAALLLLQPLCALADPLPVPPTQPPKGDAALPDPGTYLAQEGALAQQGFAYEGSQYDVWYYPLTAYWGEQITRWMQECASRGYRTQTEMVEGHTAYVAQGVAGRAILIPDYYEQIMLMKDQALEMEPYQPQQIELGLGDAILVYNGLTVQPDGLVQLTYQPSFANAAAYFEVALWGSNMPFQNVKLHFPADMQTGDVLHCDQNAVYDGALLSVFSSAGSNTRYFLFNQFRDQAAFQGPEDYCDIHIVYRDEQMIHGVCEGVFEGGATTITLAFFLPTP